jgi:ABC-type sugar transport system ATPase subunit
MDLYEHPATLFVAEFIGSPKMNTFPVEIVEASATGAKVRTGAGETLRLAVDASRAQQGDTVTLGIRPEDLGLVAGDGEAGSDVIRAAVSFVETLGNVTYAYLVHGEQALTVQLSGDIRPKAGATLVLHLPPSKGHLFDGGGRAFRRI